MHGPVIPGPDGRSAKAILIAFIDDATRRIVHAEFSTSEHSLAFEKGIRHILLAHGRIGRLYVDYPEKKQMPKLTPLFFVGKEIDLRISA